MLHYLFNVFETYPYKVKLTNQQCIGVWDVVTNGGLCVRYKIIDGMEEWLSENCGFYKIFESRNEIYFFKAVDVMAFKLRWAE